jgi:hypothetical protein
VHLQLQRTGVRSTSTDWAIGHHSLNKPEPINCLNNQLPETVIVSKNFCLSYTFIKVAGVQGVCASDVESAG